MTATAVSAPQKAVSASQRAWPVVVATVAGSAALAGAEALLGYGTWYVWALTAVVAIAGGLIAANDVVSLTLPNRYTAAFAAAAAIQVIVTAAVRHDAAIALWAAVAAAGIFAVYVAFGLIGWVGFGDAKFAAGLGLAAAITTGLDALYIVPVAILVAGVWRGLRNAFGDRERHQPHGPALAIATALILTAGALIR